MTRVLLVCPEPLGHKQPAGIGIRFLEMERVLRADGHDVTLLSPGGRVGEPVPHVLRDLTASHDVAVVQGHIANELFAHGRAIPTVVDLYDPFIIENLHYHQQLPQAFANDHATLMQSLERGDFFLCASESQRHFYLGALLAAGRLDPAAFESDPTLRTLIDVAPFGVPPPRARAPRDLENPRVLFGGIYDWYDPILAIEAVAIARKQSPNLTLTFNTHPNPELTPQGKLAEAKRKATGFVTFEPWVPYEERAAYYDRFAAALLTFPQSIETDLSMRTRVFDYLWGGLPIVSSSAPGTDEIIVGAVVHSNDPREYADALLRVLREDIDTRQFVEDHQWPRTLAPLRDFVNKTHIARERPSFFARLKRRIGGGL